MSAEQAARQTIDKLLAQAGWAVQDCRQGDIHPARGVAICEFVLNEEHGFADYPLDNRLSPNAAAATQWSSGTTASNRCSVWKAAPSRDTLG